ncbi:MAG: FixH family protein [Pseudomonadota bacterium]
MTMSSSENMGDTEFRLKGWHVLACLLGFFAVIIVANGIFLTYAIKSFPGEHVKKSYVQGRNYNEILSRREIQAAMGWNVAIETASRGETHANVIVSFTDQNQRPLRGLSVIGELSRPASKHADQTIALVSLGNGRYQGVANEIGPGVWILDLLVLDDAVSLGNRESVEVDRKAGHAQQDAVSPEIVFETSARLLFK